MGGAVAIVELQHQRLARRDIARRPLQRAGRRTHQREAARQRRAMAQRLQQLGGLGEALRRIPRPALHRQPEAARDIAGALGEARRLRLQQLRPEAPRRGGEPRARAFREHAQRPAQTPGGGIEALARQRQQLIGPGQAARQIGDAAAAILEAMLNGASLKDAADAALDGFPRNEVYRAKLRMKEFLASQREDEFD